MKSSIRQGLLVAGVIGVVLMVMMKFGRGGYEGFYSFHNWPPKPRPAQIIEKYEPRTTVDMMEAVPESRPLAAEKMIGLSPEQRTPLKENGMYSGRIEEFNNFTVDPLMSIRDRHFSWLQNQPQTDYYEMARAYDRQGESMQIDPMPAVIGRIARVEGQSRVKGHDGGGLDGNCAPNRVGEVVVPNLRTHVQAIENL